MKILLTNRTYDILKWVCLIALPALAALAAAVGEIWHVPNATQLVLTINAAAAFLGALLGVSCAQYKEAEHDG